MYKREGANRPEAVAKAGTWVVAGKVTARGIDFCSLLILAHLLSPADFGLVALAMTAILIIEVVLELPLAQAMIRIPAPTEPMFATAFTLGVMRGTLLACSMGLLAWPLSLFYQEPRLVALIWVLALAPVLRGLVSPRMVVFMKRFDFRREFALDVIGKSSAFIVAIGVALGTGSYWAIAAGAVTTPLVTVVLSYVFAPLRPRLTLSQWFHFSDMVSWNTASQLISALNWQMDKLLLGRLMDLTSFGRYAVADNLSGIPQQALVQPLARPLMAAFATITSPTAYATAYCKAMNAMFSTSAPILVCLAMLSDPFVRIVLGEKWIEAAPMLQWLALSYLLSVPTEALPPLAMAMNRTRIVAVRMIAEFVVKLPALIIGLTFFGLTGALIARCVATAAVLVSVALLVNHLTGVSIKQQCQALWRPVVACAAMAIFLFFVSPFVETHQSAWLLALATAAAGGAALAIYGGVLLILWTASARPAGVETIVVKRACRMLTSMRLRAA
jgi:O-antigen/teichoic acid export membrane protein